MKNSANVISKFWKLPDKYRGYVFEVAFQYTPTLMPDARCVARITMTLGNGCIVESASTRSEACQKAMIEFESKMKVICNKAIIEFANRMRRPK